jgi:hypothetical protein
MASGGEPTQCIYYALAFASHCFITCGNDSCPQGMSCKSINAGLNKVCAFNI